VKYGGSQAQTFLDLWDQLTCAFPKLVEGLIEVKAPVPTPADS